MVRCYLTRVIRRIAIGLGGAAIGAMVGWTASAFTGWRPAIAVGGILFGVIAVWVEERGTSA